MLWATRECPLVQLGGFHTGEWNSVLQARRGHVYSWLMNNLYFTNFQPAQGGQSSYTYRITSRQGALSGADVRRWGDLYGNPALGRVAPVRPGSYRWIEVAPETVTAQLLTHATEDPGVFVLRLKETSGEPTTTKITWRGRHEADVFQTDYLELAPAVPVPGDGRSFQLTLGAHQLATLRIVPRPE